MAKPDQDSIRQNPWETEEREWEAVAVIDNETDGVACVVWSLT